MIEIKLDIYRDKKTIQIICHLFISLSHLTVISMYILHVKRKCINFKKIGLLQQNYLEVGYEIH